MINGVLILKTCLIAWWIVEFYILASVMTALMDILKVENKLIKWIFINPFECLKCSAFWVGLILSGSIYIAIISSLIMDQYDRKLNTINI
jgi:hypothetical protein